MVPSPFMFSIGTLSILLIIALISIALLLVYLLLLERRLARFTRGKNGSSLEATIKEILSQNEGRENFEEDAVKALRILDRRLMGSIRGTAVVRFDAFEGSGSGGKQSFAAALLSEAGDGVVLSSLHARESTRIFAKPVAGFASEFELTDEERAAITEAKQKTKTH